MAFLDRFRVQIERRWHCLLIRHRSVFGSGKETMTVHLTLEGISRRISFMEMIMKKRVLKFSTPSFLDSGYSRPSIFYTSWCRHEDLMKQFKWNEWQMELKPSIWRPTRLNELSIKERIDRWEWRSHNQKTGKTDDEYDRMTNDHQE